MCNSNNIQDGGVRVLPQGWLSPTGEFIALNGDKPNLDIAHRAAIKYGFCPYGWVIIYQNTNKIVLLWERVGSLTKKQMDFLDLYFGSYLDVIDHSSKLRYNRELAFIHV